MILQEFLPNRKIKQFLFQRINTDSEKYEKPNKNDKYRDLPIFPLILPGLFIDATNTANSHSLLPDPVKDFRPILTKKMGLGEKNL